MEREPDLRAQLRHGAAEVRVDREAGRVHVALVRRVPLGLTRGTVEGIRTFTTYGLAVVAWAVWTGILPSSLLSPWILVPVVVGYAFLTLFGVLFRPDVRRFRGLSVDVGLRQLTVGRLTIPLDDARVRVTDDEWQLENDDGWALGIGDAWGGPGASWLQNLLDRLRVRGLEDLELEPPVPEAPRPRVQAISPSPRLGTDHAAAVAGERVAPFQRLAESAFPGVLIVGFVAAVILLTDSASTPGAGVFWLAVGAWLTIGSVRTWQARRRQHHYVRVDGRSLTWTEASRTRLVRLDDVAAVHLSPEVVQIDLRDGTMHTVGLGWSAEALQELHDTLEEARRAPPPPDAGSADEVPDSLLAMRRGREGQTT